MRLLSHVRAWYLEEELSDVRCAHGGKGALEIERLRTRRSGVIERHIHLHVLLLVLFPPSLRGLASFAPHLARL
jgi:hypothetical protein